MMPPHQSIGTAATLISVRAAVGIKMAPVCFLRAYFGVSFLKI
jgi:hypothetical protein